ncbi:MAG: MFS transporter [Methylovirgula sp.]
MDSRGTLKRDANVAAVRRARPGVALAAAIATVSMVGVGLSLSMALLAVRLAQAGYSARAIGLNPAAGGLATLAIATFVPRLARWLGVQTLLFMALLAAILSLGAFAAYENYWSWLVIRGVFGAALTVLFVLSEFWINTAAPPNRRGIILGLYTTSLAAGFAIGPTILAVTGTKGLPPFLAAIALFMIAAVPVALVGGQAPQIEEQAKTSLWSFLTAAPSATLAALIYGAIETAAMGLLPVYALRNALSAETGALLVSLFALGNVIFQIPMGLLSDRYDRRRLLRINALTGLLGALALSFALQANFILFATLLVVWGGVVGSLYAIGLAHLGSRYQGPELAGANAAYIMLYSVGMLAGPPFLGVGLDLAPSGLFLAIALLLAAYLGIVSWRIGTAHP